MTFEEFLIKKKIDLVQFKIAEPGLFAEFQSHYSQMGGKSFDHSKKFLFNKLRRTYHLKEELKPVVTKEPVEINEIAAQAEPLISPTVEATVYTPRFKAPGVPDVGTSASSNDKPAYKPRFKAPAVESPEPKTAEAQKDPVDQPKPTFKPRFKPGITKQVETADETIAEGNADDKPKSAYIPRFKAPGTAEPSKTNEIKDTAPPAPESKPAYKPRFKAKVTPAPENASAEQPDAQTPASEEEKPAYKPRFKANITPAAEDAQEYSDTQSSGADDEKPVYKPRFKPSMLKPKKEE